MGYFLTCGIAKQGGTQNSRPDLPIMTNELTNCSGRLLRLQAQVIQQYCPEEWREKKAVYMDGESFNCNFLTRNAHREDQSYNDDWYWHLNQVALRVMQEELSMNDLREKQIAWHVDDKDILSKQPLTFLPIGGDDGKGGHVPGSDHSRFLVAELQWNSLIFIILHRSKVLPS